MTLTLWTTAALVLWIVLWAIGAKAWDAFMLAALVIIVGATIDSLKRFQANRRS